MKDNFLKPLKLWLRKPFPHAYDRLQSWYWHRKYRSVYATVERICDGKVISGPFAGMRYLRQATGSAILPKLIGTYEAELHFIFDSMQSAGYDSCVDIGCAEGYYAVGIAGKLRVPVFAYDIDQNAQRLTYELALLNKVEQFVKICQACSAADLNLLREKRALIIADCEGFEKQLFSQVDPSNLLRCDLIIECHDFITKDASSTVVNALSQSHRLTRIPVAPRPAIDFPQSAEFRLRDWCLAVDEGRPHNQIWIWAQSKNSGNCV